MRAACASLDRDFGIQFEGSVTDVNYTGKLGDIAVRVDWNTAVGNGKELTDAQIRASGALELAKAVADAAGVWFNVTKDKQCYEIASEAPAAQEAAAVPQLKQVQQDFESPKASCPACPPRDNCPPCPVSFCDFEDTEPCNYKGTLS